MQVPSAAVLVVRCHRSNLASQYQGPGHRFDLLQADVKVQPLAEQARQLRQEFVSRGTVAFHHVGDDLHVLKTAFNANGVAAHAEMR